MMQSDSLPIREALRRAFCTALFLAAGTLAAPAADPVFPPGSRIGLTPPSGFVVSNVFRGFEDRDNKALILIFELPAAAFAEIGKSTSIEAVRKQGLSIEKREDLDLPGGKAVLFSGTEEAGGIKARKWLMFVGGAGFTAAVNVQVPETAKDVYPDAAIRTALESIATRANPIQEQLGLLPFHVSDLSGFEVTEVTETRTLVLAEPGKQGAEIVTAPHMLLGALMVPSVAAEERANFAREALSGLVAFKEMRVTYAEPLRLGGQQGFEIRADAKHTQSGTDVSIVQWVRFGTGGVLRIIGITPKDQWAAAFPRFRTVRDSIVTR